MNQTHPNTRWTFRLPALLAVAALGALPAAALAQKAEFSLSASKPSLSWGGTDVLADSLPSVETVVFQTRSVNPENNFYKYEFHDGSLEGVTTEVDPKANTVRRQYKWGTLTVRYRQAGNKLVIGVTLTNDSDRMLANFRIRLAELKLSSIPEGLAAKPRRGNRLESTVDRPIAYELGIPGGKLYASYESHWPPVRFGLDGFAEGSKGPYPLLVTGGVTEPAKGELTIPPKGTPYILPGKKLDLEFAIRLADARTHRHVVLKEFYEDYQEYLAPLLDWPDNRPVGATFLLNEWGKEATKAGVEGTNPRRWFSPTTDVVDVLSPHGRAMLRKCMQGYGIATISTLREMGAQGIVLWNLEGAFHGTGFVGDPRMLPIINPEMEDAVDDYFRMVREAGFRVGCTIRHPQLRWQSKRGQWTQGVGNANPDSDPVRDGYEELVPDHTPWWTVYPLAERLSAKIGYAKKRWGCTLFYYDTSNILRFYGDGSQRTRNLVNEHIFRKIREDHPDVLIFPEIVAERGHLHVGQLARIVPYGQTGYGRIRPMVGDRKKGFWDYTRDIVPNYFGFHYIHDSGGDPWVPRTDRINEIVWGEILVTDGWAMGPKQEAIAEHFRHASDKMRRVTAFARRFGLARTPGEHLPLSYTVREGRAISTDALVTDPPASPQLRAWTASSADQREAALLLAWYGWPYSPGASLKPALPGVDLAGGPHRLVWDIETGRMIHTGEAIEVTEAPATMFRALYARSADQAPTPNPDSVVTALSFDEGLAPDYAPDLLDDHGKAERASGASGQALVIGGRQGPARYGVVPSWFEGTAEFDLRVEKATAKPLPLVRFRHHLDANLSLVLHEGKPALKLQSIEKVEGGLAPAYAPWPADGQWHRVVLVWEVGQYRLYIDGKREMLRAAPSKLRWRDGTVFQPGLFLGGDSETGARAMMDSFILYDWAFGDDHAAGRTTAAGFKPLTRPELLFPSVYLFGDSPKKATEVAVNFRRFGNHRTRGCVATLYEVVNDKLAQLSTGESQAYRGVRSWSMEYEPKETIDTAMPDIDMEGELKLDGLAETELIKEFVLKIKAGAAGAKPPPRTIRFRFGLDKAKVRHWSVPQEAELKAHKEAAAAKKD